MEKKEIRQKIVSDLKKLDKSTYEQHSFEIAKKLYQLPVWKKANTVALTISRPPEVDTWQIIRSGWLEGKRMVVPKCHPETKQMVFRQITSFTQLESVYFGLYEPKEDETDEVRQQELDLIIVPGVAFNFYGYRIGFGGGYYDRYLQHFNGETMSLAFSLQLCQVLPVEKHDIPVKAIMTEKDYFSF
ncbi:5-formyltetrahydrofolate cyclo-ligase [Heyndrickxia shackletonii]|uniref:5-formyltetrahydrofolate cyclo-ligase n=1 Tax=Heyndrickxia shackletonii TaxID=157838 RepID=A0A0Q3WWW8_9BACI|nr:5-formyltetrahydrofolate cyclo-ligase [Heyndrickxia shackletonii]KQL53540.1 5-formyltetrahydrofolate cyclo-ligase [Heyndrickxia shackletonii]NEY99619.1 5-formyltetrahydrofolate cyclo-ligase [Heyndrickxia shackletonii]